MKKILILFTLLFSVMFSYANDSIPDSLASKTPVLDKTEHLIDKYGSKIADTFARSLETAKPIAKEAFQSIVYLQIAKGVGLLLPLVFFIVFLILLKKEYDKIDNILNGNSIPEHMNSRKGPLDEDNITPFLIIYLALVVISLILAIINTYSGVLHLLAPRWYAFKEIIELFK